MINIDKPQGDVVMIGKCYEGVISHTGVMGKFKKNDTADRHDIKNLTLHFLIVIHD